MLNLFGMCCLADKERIEKQAKCQTRQQTGIFCASLPLFPSLSLSLSPKHDEHTRNFVNVAMLFSHSFSITKQKNSQTSPDGDQPTLQNNTLFLAKN